MSSILEKLEAAQAAGIFTKKEAQCVLELCTWYLVTRRCPTVEQRISLWEMQRKSQANGVDFCGTVDAWLNELRAAADG